VDVVEARGVFKGPHKVEAEGQGKVYTAKDIILAPGGWHGCVCLLIVHIKMPFTSCLRPGPHPAARDGVDTTGKYLVR
jgi:hypothetical protein